jgi:hypothetical protein
VQPLAELRNLRVERQARAEPGFCLVEIDYSRVVESLAQTLLASAAPYN